MYYQSGENMQAICQAYYRYVTQVYFNNIFTLSFRFEKLVCFVGNMK